MTRFRVFGMDWVQSTTFLGSFSSQDYLVVIGLYASLYVGDEETYFFSLFLAHYPYFHILLHPLLALTFIFLKSLTHSTWN